MTPTTSNEPSEQPEKLSLPVSSDESLFPKIERDYENLFNQISKLEESQLIVRPNCKFCNHPARADGELKWEQSGGSYTMVEKFFAKYSEQNPQYPKMTYHNIHDHIWNHYTEQVRKIFLKEYGNRLQEFINFKVTTAKRFDGNLAVLEMQIFDLASNPMIDAIKKSQTIVQLMKMQLEISVAQAKLNGEMEHGAVMTEKFMNTWMHIMAKTKDENVRKGLMEALNDFQSELESVSFDVNK